MLETLLQTFFYVFTTFPRSKRNAKTLMWDFSSYVIEVCWSFCTYRHIYLIFHIFLKSNISKSWFGIRVRRKEFKVVMGFVREIFLICGQLGFSLFSPRSNVGNICVGVYACVCLGSYIKTNLFFPFFLWVVKYMRNGQDIFYYFMEYLLVDPQQFCRPREFYMYIRI